MLFSSFYTQVHHSKVDLSIINTYKNFIIIESNAQLNQVDSPRMFLLRLFYILSVNNCEYIYFIKHVLRPSSLIGLEQLLMILVSWCDSIFLIDIILLSSACYCQEIP